MDELGSKQQTKLHDDNTRSRLSIRRKLFWAWPLKSHDNTEDNYHPKRYKHNKHILKLISICLLGTASPTFASDIGGVSATANPVANSSGSVTNQVIQVLQSPYITNTYGNGISCQGPHHECYSVPYWKYCHKEGPYEDYWMDPVYNNVDANNDDVPDNPGQILYYKPVKTNQKDSTTVSLGVSATWSKPLDKKLQEQCKQAAEANIALMNQAVANKRLDFEIARLKNCGELMRSSWYYVP